MDDVRNDGQGGEAERRAAFAAKLQAARQARNLSLSELARMAGIAKSNLSRMEQGDGNPSLETLWALSAALGLNVRDLIDPVAGGTRLYRREEPLEARAENADFAVALVSSCPVGALRDIYRATLEPGAPKYSEPHRAGTIEHVFLLSGRARIGPAERPETLGPGDYLTFSGAERHVYEALAADTTAIIVMEFR